MLYKRFNVFFFICLSSLPLFVFAQNKLDSVQHLSEIVVTQSRISTEAIPVQTLSGSLLNDLSVHSVADAMRYFSGVQLKDYGGIGGLKTVDVRGMGSQHVGVFYDGIEIGNPQNGVVDLGRYSLDNMEAISLYNGQKSAIFQPAKDYASASSIYMTTKTPDFRGNKKQDIKTTFKTGAFDLVNPSILWSQELSDNVSGSLNAEYIYSSGKYKFKHKVVNKTDNRGGYDTTEVRKNGDIRVYRLEHALFGKMEGGDWKTKVYFYNSERGYPGADVKEPGKFSHEDRQWDTNLFFQASLKKKMSYVYSTLFSGKYAYDYIHYVAGDYPGPELDNKYKLHEAYLSSANFFNILPFWNANVSTDFMWNKMDSNMKEFIYPQRYSGWVAVATSFYFERVKIQASLLGSFVHENTKEEKQDIQQNWDKYTPTLIASWQPFESHDLHLRFFYKNIFRMPTFSEMYLAYMGSLSSLLEPEYTKQYNVGITYAKTIKRSLNIGAQVDVYHNKITNKLMAIPGGVNFRWTMKNLGLVQIRGIDVALNGDTQIGTNTVLTARLNYTYQKARDCSDSGEPSTYKGQIAYIPWHSGSAIVGAKYKTWNLNYSFIYTGKRYDGSANIPENRIKEWYTHDLSLSKSLYWMSTDLRLTTEINNLFNQQYDVILNYPMPGTNFKFIINITI
ncbi:MAG: TonB-dependent receptor [Prevotella sp.]|jgi:outer membrane cobalamin receptor|nr:TonB-dependent receptor [Prevotella sp.]